MESGSPRTLAATRAMRSRTAAMLSAMDIGRIIGGKRTFTAETRRHGGSKSLDGDRMGQRNGLTAKDAKDAKPTRTLRPCARCGEIYFFSPSSGLRAKWKSE